MNGGRSPDRPRRGRRRPLLLIVCSFVALLLLSGCATEEEIAETTAALEAVSEQLSDTHDEFDWVSATYSFNIGFHEVTVIQVAGRGEFNDRAHLDQVVHAIVYDIWHSAVPEITSITLRISAGDELAATDDRPGATDVRYEYTQEQLEGFLGPRRPTS